MNDEAPAQVSAKVSRSPGTLVSRFQITLHMKHSLLLHAGRKETKKVQGILGLDGFARNCSMVNGSAAARAVIEERLKYAEDRLSNLARQNTEAHRRNRLAVELHSSTTPVVINFETTTAMAGRGAQLLQIYDEITRDIVLLNRLGIYSFDDANERSRLCSRYVRGAFASAFEALGKVRRIKNEQDSRVADEKTIQ